MKGFVVAIVGMSGSGKSEAAHFFKKSGYTVIRFGSVIDDAIKEAGLPWSPENNVIYRRKVREEGMDAVARRLYPKIEKASIDTDKILLDGLYSWDEYTYLIEKIPDLKMLCIYARPEIRYKRLKKRKERPFTEKEARRRDITEIEDIKKGGPIAFADYLINNETTIAHFHKELSKFLKWLENE